MSIEFIGSLVGSYEQIAESLLDYVAL